MRSQKKDECFHFLLRWPWLQACPDTQPKRLLVKWWVVVVLSPRLCQDVFVKKGERRRINNVTNPRFLTRQKHRERRQ